MSGAKTSIEDPAPLTALLDIRGVSKSFPGVRALDGVDFSLAEGEVHALLGENGAGKSTLINIVTGALRRDSGAMRLAGKSIDPHSPIQALRAGIAAVHQEAPLLLNLSVAENLYFGREATRWGLVRRRQMHANAKRVLADYGLDLDVTRPLGSFSLAIQHLVGIARAIDLSARVLVLDEPTASLDTAEVKALFGVVRSLASRGVGVIFITHFLDQVFDLSDRITVLRNGRVVGDGLATSATGRSDLVALMLGRELQAAEAMSAPPASTTEAVVRIKGLGGKGAAPFDLDFHAGEVVGAAGLLGSGRTETALLMFGATPARTGDVSVRGATRRFTKPLEAMKQGLAMLPEDRKRDGIVGALSVRDNIALALQAKRGWLKPLSNRARRELADRFIGLLHIKTPDADKPIEQLSGGNQQKALLARWLATEPLLMLLDEPTRGIDVGAHAEILRFVDQMRAEGMAVYLISSELEELAAVAHRVCVMREGRQVAMLSGNAITPSAIMTAIAEVEHTT